MTQDAAGASVEVETADGPYTLTNLLLVDHAGAALVVQEAQAARLPPNRSRAPGAAVCSPPEAAAAR